MVEVQRAVELLAPQGKRIVLEKAEELHQTGYDGRFNANIHLDYSKPKAVHTLDELGLDGSAANNKSRAVAVSEIAYTEPFRLLSAEGVQAVRSEIFSKKVLDSCMQQVSNQQGDALKYMSIRNPGKQSSFLLDMWRSPLTQACIDDAVGGYPLVPTMDHECSHANLQVPQMRLDGEGAQDGWHTDGNAQFVVVVMLSDPTRMLGGETEVRCGDGSIRRITYPAPGYAIMLQGMVVHHNVKPVLSAEGRMSGERLTMVTSFQPADYKQPQQSIVGYLRNYSDEEQLLGEWAEWRFKVMSKRLADASAKIKADRKVGRFDLEYMRGQAEEMRHFLAITEREMAADYCPLKVYT